VYSREEVAGGLVIACGDGSKLLEFGKEVLNQMPCRVSVTVEFPWLLTIGLRRDHRSLSRSSLWLDYSPVGIEGLIGDQHIGLHIWQEFVSPHKVMGSATGQMKTNRIAERINQGVDFGAYTSRPMA
jgi:hypothetical protein